jgi:hypothetical protein
MRGASSPQCTDGGLSGQEQWKELGDLFLPTYTLFCSVRQTRSIISRILVARPPGEISLRILVARPPMLLRCVV